MFETICIDPSLNAYAIAQPDALSAIADDAAIPDEVPPSEVCESMSATFVSAAGSDVEIHAAPDRTHTSFFIQPHRSLDNGAPLSPVASWALPPVFLAVGLRRLLRSALNWMLKKLGKRPSMLVERAYASLRPPSLAPAPKARASDPARSKRRPVMEEACEQWRAVGKKEIRTLLFRANEKSDGTKAALVIGSMLHLKDSASDAVPFRFIDAPHCFISCQELMYPGLTARNSKERMAATATEIEAIIDKARKGPAMLVLTEIDLLSGEEAASPILRTIVRALQDNDVRTNLLFVTSALTPGWKISSIDNRRPL